jgi:Skp family chaperone for outer membrane proteins
LRTFTTVRRLVKATPPGAFGPRVAALLAIVLVALASPATLAADARKTTRIGIIDSRSLLRDMPGREVAEAQFAREIAGARELVRAATGSLQEAVDDLARADDNMRPQQREAAVMVIRARELALEDMVAQLNGLAQKRLAELQAPLRERLKVAIRSVRTREKLSLVVDLADGGFVVDADEALNINPLVLAELNRTAPRETD